MWLAGGLAVVAAGIVVVAVALLEEDRRRVVPTRRGTVTAAELRAAQLPTAWRGYDRGHVDALLARAAQTLEDVQRYGTVEPVHEATEDREPHRAAPPSFLRFTTPDDGSGHDPGQDTDPEDADGSGEELEDGGGDGAGGLDR